MRREQEFATISFSKESTGSPPGVEVGPPGAFLWLPEVHTVCLGSWTGLGGHCGSRVAVILRGLAS